MPRLIDADALDEKLADLMLKYAWQGRDDRAAEYAFCRGQVMAAQTIDPESLRPHGRWEKHYHSYFGHHQCVCSECKEDEYWKKYYCYGVEKFCPNCGAKMDLEEDDALEK